MVLSDHSIREEIAAGRIVVDPFVDAMVQPCSIDVTVGDSFRVFRNSRYPYIDVKREMEDLTELVRVGRDEPFILHPGEFVLGVVAERVALPDDIVATLDGKSSLGRLGLVVHQTAGVIDAGFDGHITLELANMANLPITVYPGMRIAQLSFLTLSTPADHPVRVGQAGQQVPGPGRAHAQPLLPELRGAPLRVLVAGGTGYVGAEVVASLASAGHSLRVLVHASEPALPEAAEAVRGDVTDAASLEAAAAGCDAIVNLVAILDGPDAAFEAVNAGGPRNVVAAASAHGIRRVVHMSALGVTAEHAPLTRYWGSKYAGKQAVTSSGLDWTVLEPSFVFGRGGGALKAFESLIRMPVAPVIGNGRYRHQPVWAGDVATAFVRALERPETAGQVIALGGPQVFTFDELLDELARVTGRAPRRKLHVPAGLVKAQTPLLSRLPPPLKVTREQIVMLLAGTECDLEPMRSALGIEPAVDRRGLHALITRTRGFASSPFVATLALPRKGGGPTC